MARRKRFKPESASPLSVNEPVPSALTDEPAPGFPPADDSVFGEVVEVPAAAAAGDTGGKTLPSAPEPAAKPSPARPLFLRKNWFSLRAAAIALLAAAGGAAGAAAPAWLDRISLADASATPHPGAAADAGLAKLAVEVAALRAAVAAADTAAQSGIARLAERLDASETMQGALVERVTVIAEGLAGQQKKVSTADVTGSVAPSEPEIVRGWTLLRVWRNRAIVEARGEYFEVAPGSALPGLGTVKRIARADGRWVVVTSRGIIVPAEG
jgi:hypothetical protein